MPVTFRSAQFRAVWLQYGAATEPLTDRNPKKEQLQGDGSQFGLLRTQSVPSTGVCANERPLIPLLRGLVLMRPRGSHTSFLSTTWILAMGACKNNSLCNCSTMGTAGQSFRDFFVVSGSVAAPYCSHTARNCANLKVTCILEPPAARPRVVGTYHRLKRARRERVYIYIPPQSQRRLEAAGGLRTADLKHLTLPRPIWAEIGVSKARPNPPYEALQDVAGRPKRSSHSPLRVRFLASWIFCSHLTHPHCMEAVAGRQPLLEASAALSAFGRFTCGASAGGGGSSRSG